MDRNDPRWNDTRITPSCGNVFIDLGFPPDEAAIMAVRAELMIRLQQLMVERRWSQTKAAKVFGIAPSRVAELKQDKHELFSVEMLLTIAARAGLRPELKLVA